jgi:spoIIIJ-associated protein
MQPIEIEGRTVAEAVEAALKQHGLRREQVEVTVLEEGSTGFMGIGAKPARVRIAEKRWGEGPVAVSKPAPPPARPPRPAPQRQAAPPPRPFIPAPTYVPPPKPATPKPKPEPRPAEARQERQERRPSRGSDSRRSEPRAPRERRDETPRPPLTAAQAEEACAKAQVLVTIAAPTVTAAWDADMERVKLNVESQDATLLVGRDGRVLESLQFLASLMMGRGGAAPVAIQVDALSYWEKREGAILDSARLAAESVKADGKPVRLEPMDASMRRLIHRSFASHPDVTTGSEGEGPWRKIVVRPRAK